MIFGAFAERFEVELEKVGFKAYGIGRNALEGTIRNLPDVYKQGRKPLRALESAIYLGTDAVDISSCALTYTVRFVEERTSVQELFPPSKVALSLIWFGSELGFQMAYLMENVSNLLDSVDYSAERMVDLASEHALPLYDDASENIEHAVREFFDEHR